MSYPPNPNPAPGFEPHYLEALRLLTDLRATRKKFERSRQSDDLKLAQKAEARADEFLKANGLPDSTTHLFTASAVPEK